MKIINSKINQNKNIQFLSVDEVGEPSVLGKSICHHMVATLEGKAGPNLLDKPKNLSNGREFIISSCVSFLICSPLI